MRPLHVRLVTERSGFFSFYFIDHDCGLNVCHVAITKGSQMSSQHASAQLQSKLKECDPEIQEYVTAFEKEVTRLQKANVSLEAKNVSAHSRIDALTDELKEHRTPIEQRVTEQERHDILISVFYEEVIVAGGWDAFCRKNQLDNGGK